MLLITGANGKLGRLIADEVLRRAPDAPLAVSVRDPSAAADLAERGLDVRQADSRGRRIAVASDDKRSTAEELSGLGALLF